MKKLLIILFILPSLVLATDFKIDNKFTENGVVINNINELKLNKCFTHSYLNELNGIYEIVLGGDYLCEKDSLEIDTKYLVLNNKGVKTYHIEDISSGIYLVINTKVNKDNLDIEALLIFILRIAILIVLIIVINIYRKVDIDEKA